MGPDMIELLAERVTAVLLPVHVQFPRTCSLGLERSMHSFMDAVLLGPSGLDTKMTDAELDPELGQMRDATN